MAHRWGQHPKVIMWDYTLSEINGYIVMLNREANKTEGGKMSLTEALAGDDVLIG